MKRAVARVLAVLVALYVGLVLVFQVFVSVDTGFTFREIFVVPAITGTAVGVFLTLKLPENRMGLLMTLMSASLATLGLGNVVVEMSLEQGNQLLTVISVQLSDLAWITQSVTAFVLLPLWFPTGRALNGRWAWVGRIAILTAVLAAASSFLAESVCAFDSSASDVCIEVPSPWGIEGFGGFEPLVVVPIAMAFPAVASAFVRWRRSGDVERNQIKWFFVAAVGLLIALSIAFADVNLVPNEVALAAGLTGVWVAIAVAVLKYRFYDIDRIISRTVSYAVVIAVLAGIYIGLVTAIGSQFEESPAVAASTLAVAALFNPLRRRVQAWVERHFNRSRYDAAQVINEFVGSLQDRVDPDGVIVGWVGVVEDTMQPSSVGVWVRE